MRESIRIATHRGRRVLLLVPDARTLRGIQEATRVADERVAAGGRGRNGALLARSFLRDLARAAVAATIEDEGEVTP